MLKQRGPKESPPRKSDAAACPAQGQAAPFAHDEPSEPSSPPCYLHEFAEQAAPTPSSSSHPRDPLHGVTLEVIVVHLVERHGWAAMARRIPVRCFEFNPSVKSSLTFLRRTPWARKKIEEWFIADKAGT